MSDPRSFERGSSPRLSEARQQAAYSRELILLCRQLGTMLNAGTDILTALLIVQDQVAYPSLRAALDTARSDMSLGWTLAMSLRRHPQLFSPFFIDMIRQGEGDGILGEVLNNLGEYLEKEFRLDSSLPAPVDQASTPAGTIPWPPAGTNTPFSPLPAYRFAICTGSGVACAALVWVLLTSLGLMTIAASTAVSIAIAAAALALWGAAELHRKPGIPVRAMFPVHPGASDAMTEYTDHARMPQADGGPYPINSYHPPLALNGTAPEAGTTHHATPDAESAPTPDHPQNKGLSSPKSSDVPSTRTVPPRPGSSSRRQMPL